MGGGHDMTFSFCMIIFFGVVSFFDFQDFLSVAFSSSFLFIRICCRFAVFAAGLQTQDGQAR